MNLDFSQSLKQDILSKQKTATIRYGWRNGIDDIRDYTNHNGEGLAKFPDGSSIAITIENVDFILYLWAEEHLSADILRRENVKATEEGFYLLLDSLKNYYPQIDIGSKVSVVFFRLKED